MELAKLRDIERCWYFFSSEINKELQDFKYSPNNIRIKKRRKQWIGIKNPSTHNAYDAYRIIVYIYPFENYLFAKIRGKMSKECSRKKLSTFCDQVFFCAYWNEIINLFLPFLSFHFKMSFFMSFSLVISGKLLWAVAAAVRSFSGVCPLMGSNVVSSCKSALADAAWVGLATCNQNLFHFYLIYCY